MIYKQLSLIVIFLFSPLIWANNHIINVNDKISDSSISFTPSLVFNTSDEMKEAIDNGIRLYLIAKAEIYQPSSWWFDKTIDKQKIDLEVSYSTLLKLYLVKNKQSGEQLGFNDYQQLWQEFNKLIVFKFPLEKSHNNWFKIRVVLDKGGLPTAMQLPVLFNSKWDVNTPWFTQEVKPK